MAFELNTLTDLATAGYDTVIDVRSPAEFAEDHVPGAINLPVLSDEERARVGTIYTQESPFLARKVGAALVARNAAAHIEGPLSEKDGGWWPLVYCWRGGQRSGSFASILAQIGWRAETLAGGYQNYRRKVVELLYERELSARVVLLDGNTGTGKTDVLKRLQAHGVQVIDLEGLARHRGSALGGQGEQPSQKAFETLLSQAIVALDPSRPVVVEAESSKIGKINLPARVFKAMRSAPRIEITAPVSERAAYLTRAYSDAISDREAFNARLERLVRLQGRERVTRWQGAVSSGAFESVAAELIELHYDPRYAKVRGRIGAEIVQTVHADSLSEEGLALVAEEVAQAVRSLERDRLRVEEPAR